MYIMKNDAGRATPIEAAAAPPRTKASNYPERLASMMAGREKRPLGDLFGLRNFGVNLTRLPPGAVSALQHVHSRQDEFVYVLQGMPTLYTDSVSTIMNAGMCIGFPAGGPAHHLANETTTDVLILEVGDRTPGDSVSYPDDDIQAVLGPDGRWQFLKKDGTP
jgi:uncharacterized cupin superfamily protein